MKKTRYEWLTKDGDTSSIKRIRHPFLPSKMEYVRRTDVGYESLTQDGDTGPITYVPDPFVEGAHAVVRQLSGADKANDRATPVSDAARKAFEANPNWRHMQVKVRDPLVRQWCLDRGLPQPSKKTIQNVAKVRDE